MLKGSHCCTSGLSFIAGASPRTVGVAAAGAAGVWRAVPWIPEPGQAGRGAPGCPLPSHGEFSAAQSPSQLPSSQPIPAAPPACWDRHCHPRDRSPPAPRPSLPPPSTCPRRGLSGCFPPTFLPCRTSPPPSPAPCPAGLGLLGLHSEEVRRSHTASWTPSPDCHQGLFSGPHTSIWIFIQDGSEHPALHGRVAPHAHPPQPFGPNTNQTPWNEPE